MAEICKRCGFDKLIQDDSKGVLFCENCGHIAGPSAAYDPAIDIEFDGMAVRWEDLDHSHDDELAGL